MENSKGQDKTVYKPAKNMIICNLRNKVKSDSIRELLLKAGIEVPKNSIGIYKTGDYGFILFKNQSDADRALDLLDMRSMNDTTIIAQTLCDEDLPKPSIRDHEQLWAAFERPYGRKEDLNEQSRVQGKLQYCQTGKTLAQPPSCAQKSLIEDENPLMLYNTYWLIQINNVSEQFLCESLHIEHKEEFVWPEIDWEVVLGNLENNSRKQFKEVIYYAEVVETNVNNESLPREPIIYDHEKLLEELKDIYSQKDLSIPDIEQEKGFNNSYDNKQSHLQDEKQYCEAKLSYPPSFYYQPRNERPYSSEEKKIPGRYLDFEPKEDKINSQNEGNELWAAYLKQWERAFQKWGNGEQLRRDEQESQSRQTCKIYETLNKEVSTEEQTAVKEQDPGNVPEEGNCSSQ